MILAAPTMPNARARLAPTTSITAAPTIARMICVWMTGALRCGVPRRRGRNASIAPIAAASGRLITASLSDSSCARKSQCAGPFVAAGVRGAMGDAHTVAERHAIRSAHDANVKREHITRCAAPETYPVDVGGGQILQQLFVPAAVLELDTAVGIHLVDEAVLLELVDVIPSGVQDARRPERRTEIPHDVPAFGHTSVLTTLVDHIVVVLQVGAVDDHHEREETAVRLRADEWIPVPRPDVEVLEPRELRPKPSSALAH